MLGHFWHQGEIVRPNLEHASVAVRPIMRIRELGHASHLPSKPQIRLVESLAECAIPDARTGDLSQKGGAGKAKLHALVFDRSVFEPRKPSHMDSRPGDWNYYTTQSALRLELRCDFSDRASLSSSQLFLVWIAVSRVAVLSTYRRCCPSVLVRSQNKRRLPGSD